MRVTADQTLQKKKISELKNTAIKTIQNVPLGEICILERQENPIKLESVRCGTNSKQSNIWVLVALKKRGRRRKKYLNKLQSKTVKQDENYKPHIQAQMYPKHKKKILKTIPRCIMIKLQSGKKKSLNFSWRKKTCREEQR